MSEPDLRYRQIHLDFHTSGDIPGIGSAFDPDAFADTLARAGVNSVTCFARCHHGYLYYDSKAHPELVHPHLAQRDLLRAQIEACHKRDIRVPIYTTVQWDQLTAEARRDWLCIDEHGQEFVTPPLKPGFYRFLDVFHPGYRQFLKDHVRDVLETLPVDGLFLDIVQSQWSLARHWIDAMDARGFDPEDLGQRRRFARRVIAEWKCEMTEFIRQFNKDCTVFYNAGHVGPRHRASVDAYTHYELESLPSGGWGYLHFPMTQRYARHLGKPTLGMTGKFHTAWGDFHSYKNEAALQYECFTMLALGAGCSVGDQLPPSGELDAATYDLVGGVYHSVAAKEPWCHGARPVSDAAVLTPEHFDDGSDEAAAKRGQRAVLGLVRLLQELRVQFDMLDPAHDLSGYRLVILPDELPVDAALAKRLEQFADAGGAVLASGRGGLDPSGERFATDRFGVQLVGDAPYSPDFVVPGEALGADLPSAAHVMYERGMQVEPANDAQVLAQVERPHFNRTWRHFCSHRHAPSAGEVVHPGIVQRGRWIYFAHPVFGQYNASSPRWVKRLVGAAIERLIGRTVLHLPDAPSTVTTALNHQADPGRYVLHLLHYIPERRGEHFDVIEDVIPLHELTVELALDQSIQQVRLVPDDEALSFTQQDGIVRFTLPRLEGHAMVELA